MNSSLQRSTLFLSLGLVPLLTGPVLAQSPRPPAAQSVPVTQAIVAFTPGPSALNTLKDALSKAQSTVDVAMFRFTDPALIEALCYLAADKQVKVRVFLNQDNQRLEEGATDEETVPAVTPSYESIYQKLIRNGVQVYAADGTSKMHLRCAVIDGQTVLTGSCNWIPQSFKGKYDDVLVLQSPGLAQAYTNKINALIPQCTQLTVVGPTLRPDVLAFPSDHEERPHKPGSKRQSLEEPTMITKPFTASVYFSPEGSGLDSLLGQIRSAKQSVDVAMRWATEARFINQVSAAATKSTVAVRLLVNRDMFEGGFQASMEQLLKSGVRTYVSKPKMNMHWKVAILDKRWVWTGSANATSLAESRDQEDMVCADSSDLASCYETAYENLITRLDLPPSK